MKKIYYMLFACVAVLALTACSLKEDEKFDTPASQRSQEYMAEVQKVLTSASNGWLMEYYGALGFGGYNVMMKFESNQVTVASEKWGRSHKAGIDADGKIITSTSHYKLEQSMGTVISIDEFNETFHYFTMPNNPDYTYDEQNGLSGDFEYRVLEAKPEKVVLRGKRNNNRIILTPIPADKTWESIIQDSEETEKYMTSRSYTLAGEGVPEGKTITATLNGSYRALIFTYKDDRDETHTVTAPYIVKPDGFYFYAPVTVDGLELDGLVKGETNDYFVFRNNENLRLDTYLPPLAESLTTSLWYQTYNTVSDYAKPVWDAFLTKLKTAGKNKKEVKLYTATMGFASKRLASNLTTDTDEPYMGFTVESNEAGDVVTFKLKSSVYNTAGRTYYNQHGWKNVLNTIYGHTFKLTTDNQRRPSYIKMTDENDATNVVTLFATPTYFMDAEYYRDK